MKKSYMLPAVAKSITSASIKDAIAALIALGYMEKHGIWEHAELCEVFFLPFPDSEAFYCEN